ncbi:Uncharacterised protein [Mycobacteroides abscessus subsp. massiliense]|nr:Uncharacterised protein [Mycobacteroides abscessus subsp. massiliense]
MQPVVSENGQHSSRGRHCHRDEVLVPAEGPVQSHSDQHLIGNIERHIREQRGEQRNEHTPIAELSTRLDHLRQPHMRPLGCMKRHEQRPDNDSGRARHDRPPEREAQ